MSAYFSSNSYVLAIGLHVVFGEINIWIIAYYVSHTSYFKKEYLATHATLLLGSDRLFCGIDNLDYTKMSCRSCQGKYFVFKIKAQPPKEWNLAICNDINGARMYYAKWNKSEKNKYHIISYVKFKKENRLTYGKGGRRERNKPWETQW